MKKSLLITITFLLFSFITFAQPKKLSKANKHFEQGNYEKAIQLYLKVLNKEDYTEAKIKLAFAYWKVKNFWEAEFWFGQIVHLENALADYSLYYSICLGTNDKCDLGKGWIDRFKEENKHDTRINYIEPFFEGVCDFSGFDYNIMSDVY